MNRAPWTDVGRLQSEVQSIKNDLRNKADNYEISSMKSRISDIERSMRDLNNLAHRIDYRLKNLEEKEDQRILNNI